MGRSFNSATSWCLGLAALLCFGCSSDFSDDLTTDGLDGQEEIDGNSNVPDSESEPSELGVMSEAISYGNNSCYLVYYNEHWVDPANPGSGEHVIGDYQCADYFATPISTYATVTYNGSVISGWMIWNVSTPNLPKYRVFADGTWYWLHLSAYFFEGINT